jgi:isopenicillin N synthase-like dioxygenase
MCTRDIAPEPFLANTMQGIDPKHAEVVFEQAKRFFSLPVEKKMEVYTGLVPNEFVGYHPMEHYSRTAAKQKG